MRILVYGDSNSWGYSPDGSGLRLDAKTRWPCVMATALGADLIEDALPGRTTVHDDPDMYGATMNGLAHLPVALLAGSPIDLLVIMLGTNDFKARFQPGAERIANNIGRLLDCARDIGGGPGAWDEGDAPALAVVVPPPLSQAVDQASFEGREEWAGGRAASLGLAEHMAKVGAARGAAVFDAGQVVAGAVADPIHLAADSHIVLGRALASWLQKLHGNADRSVG
jgi:lysophospholipase L1-like esterase